MKSECVYACIYIGRGMGLNDVASGRPPRVRNGQDQGRRGTMKEGRKASLRPLLLGVVVGVKGGQGDALYVCSREYMYWKERKKEMGVGRNEKKREERAGPSTSNPAQTSNNQKQLYSYTHT